MVATTAVRSVESVMSLLAAGVPLTLLVDLVDPAGPPSGEILLHEAAASPARHLATRASA
jgi:hypothetical protein